MSAGMVKVKVTTTTTRKEIIVDAAKTIGEILREADVSVSGDVSINVSGVNYSSENLSKALKDVPNIDLGELIYITVVVNSKNA